MTPEGFARLLHRFEVACRRDGKARARQDWDNTELPELDDLTEQLVDAFEKAKAEIPADLPDRVAGLGGFFNKAETVEAIRAWMRP